MADVTEVRCLQGVVGAKVIDDLEENCKRETSE
jgi:hypothetical protein